MTLNIEEANSQKESVLSYADKQRSSFEAKLKKIVDLASVSMEPERRPEIDGTAELALAYLREMGAKGEIVKTKGYPVVIGEFHHSAKAPTVTVYNHLDVQPALASEWLTEPFDMQIDGEVYRGRGTTDDKGPALTVLSAAYFAHQAGIPINIKFIWELEEEIGSPSFESFLTENLAKLKTDSVVVSDTIWVSRERPAIPYGLRGLQAFLIKLKTGTKDVHSGTTGGLARNPIGEMAGLIAAIYDPCTGEVRIPGFYDAVRPVDESELDNFVASGFTVENFKRAHELGSTRTMDAAQGAKRIWAHPTFEVHGITGGYAGPGVKTIVPYQSEAKLSTRLVPDQDPEKIFELIKAFVQSYNPDFEVLKEGSLKPFLGEFVGPFAEAAKGAMQTAFGVEPAFTREGGSIGAVVSMQEKLNVPITFMGLSLPEHGYHAINENFDWQQARGGQVMFVDYFHRLSKLI
ncbi:MAG: M20/M25/M40 family metallo-hydrolase [Candidatus Melainabacteria bacterium]|nr:M20/M25/M40 family metallo-hydrolase [Candidatus Melainabacteria bacterium]